MKLPVMTENSKNVLTADLACLCVFIMSDTCLRVNLHSAVDWISRNSLLETDAISEIFSNCNGIWNGNHLVSKWKLNHLAKVAPFTVQNFKKKFSLQVQNYKDLPFSDQKWPVCPNFLFDFIFFRNSLITIVPFLHLYLYSKNPSQVPIH